MNISTAEKIARKMIETTYIGVCDIIEYAYTVNPITRLSEKSKITVVSNQPCRISFEMYNRNSIKSVKTDDMVSEVRQSIKLFIAPEITVNPGSVIVVTQNGVTTAYKKSGQPSVYFSHQEILLDLYDEFA